MDKFKSSEKIKDEIDGDEETVEPAIEWPTKCISEIKKMEVNSTICLISKHMHLQILCKVEFIDFEGRSDGESIKKILSQIKPKQLVIVHGSAEATRNLADFCEENQIVQV